jgi:Alkaline phosphatase PhoX
MYKNRILIALAAGFVATSAAALSTFDFGMFRDKQLDAYSEQLFGIVSPVDASSTESISAAEANADPTRLVTLAKGLHARVVSANSNLPPNIDMMALWPANNPTHLIACNEQGTGQPGLVRIRLSDGAVQTILTGTTSCDPVKRTAWGTLIFGEEAGTTGNLLEIINPLATTGVMFDRVTGSLSGADSGNVALRRAVGHLSFEGLALLPNGVLYYGDENRPGATTAGGAYFKFIPDNPWMGTSTITNLSQSPLVGGSVYGLRLGKNGGSTDNGQGTNTGLGTWVQVQNSYDANLRAAATALHLTGYYRPEDAEIDPGALGHGLVRFCANNTGNEDTDHNWGETICVTDGFFANVTSNTAAPEVQYLVIGTTDFAMMDNLAYQPIRGNWIIHEDGDAPERAVNPHNNDLWSCVDDGDDADGLSDGCARIATINDLNAEWTGGTFDSGGNHFYVSVQHNVTGHGVILDIYGWR